MGAAVRDALRFPLSGAPLEALVKRGGRVTIVVEPPELPLPGAPNDPRREALAATLAELERLGVPSQHRRSWSLEGSTAGRGTGSRRRSFRPCPPAASTARSRFTTQSRRTSSIWATPDAHPSASIRGCSKPTSSSASPPPRRVLHGGPGALLGACGPETLRAATAYSLLETAAARGWQLGLALERMLAARVPVIGTSLVLNPPRLLGRFRGYPYEEASLRHLVASPLRRYLAPSARSAPQDPPRSRARADGRRGLRGTTVGRSRGGSPPGDRTTLGSARAAARRDRDRDAVGAPPLPARAAEPADRGDGRTRAGAQALARLVSRRRGGNGDRAPPALASLRARDAGSVPRALPRAPRRPNGGGARRRRAGGGLG